MKLFPGLTNLWRSKAAPAAAAAPIAPKEDPARTMMEALIKSHSDAWWAKGGPDIRIAPEALEEIVRISRTEGKLTRDEMNAVFHDRLGDAVFNAAMRGLGHPGTIHIDFINDKFRCA